MKDTVLGRLVACMAIATAAASAACAPATPDMPTLPSRAETISELVPPGWEAEAQQTPDLDADGRPDLLLLLRRRADAGSGPTHESPPRMLAAALAQRRGGYALLLQNNELIPRVDMSEVEDPLAGGGLGVVHRGFGLTLGGAPEGATVSTLSFNFRLREGCLRLVAFERSELHVATRDTLDTRVDYLQGRITRKRGNTLQPAAEERTRRTPRTRLCAQDLGNAWAFEPLAH